MEANGGGDRSAHARYYLLTRTRKRADAMDVIPRVGVSKGGSDVSAELVEQLMGGAIRSSG